MAKLKPQAYVALALVVGGVGYGAVRLFAPDLLSKATSTVFPEKRVAESNVPLQADLPNAPAGDVTTAPVAAVAPSGGSFPQLSALDLQAGCSHLPELRWGMWYWNTHNGLIAANGGPVSAKGSKMCARGVNVRLVREDMIPQQFNGLVAFATEYAGGVEFPTKGFAFISLMGDSTAALFTDLKAALTKLGPEYGPVVVGSGGYSRGEDAFMGPKLWKDNPQAARGGVTVGVLRDGDWNITMKWLRDNGGDNGLCNNPDEGTYDPECMNWIAAADYLDASKKYVANACEERPVVRKGKKTGETKRVCPQAVVTWTPGDNIAADNRGGLVRIVSTAEYRYQMPMVIVGVKKWMRAHPEAVEGILDAMFEANDEIRASDAAMRRASALAAVVYKEQGADAAYVYKYFHGAVEPDKIGVPVARGGSSVSNLADNCQLFGLQSCAPGSTSIYKAVYQTFGNIARQQYPALIPQYPAYETIEDTSFLERLAQRKAPTTQPDLPTFAATQPVTEVVSRRSWSINFATGQATFTNGAHEQLGQLFNDLVIAGSAAVEVHGHTDDIGNPDANQALSERRAFAVKQWLEAKSSANFPQGRVRVFAHGESEPVQPNATETGRAANRRVEVIVGMTQN